MPQLTPTRKRDRPGPQRAVRRQDVLDLEHYAPIGDGRALAVCGLDGSIDWWCVPTIGSPPVFDRIVGGSGSFMLQPTGPFEVTRRYRPDSNVLETVFITKAGRARLVESLNSGLAGLLPWCELARRIDGLEGSVEFKLALRLSASITTATWERQLDGSLLIGAGDVTACLKAQSSVLLRHSPRGASARFQVATGERSVVALLASHDSPLALTPITAIDYRIDESDSQWRRWSNKLSYDGLYPTEVRRSALALKLLLFSPSGAIAAAGTCSLPEKIGGKKNWDYRYAWTRDVAYSIKALLRVGAFEEAHAAVGWLFRTLKANAPEIEIFYTLDGVRGGDETPSTLPGYRGSRPVRFGNAAIRQRQLGLYGDVLVAGKEFIAKGHQLDRNSKLLLETIVDRAAREWRLPDSGTWELDEQEHFTISKMGCWLALDLGVKLAEEGHLSGRKTGRWIRAREAVHQWIEKHCWSEKRSTYLMSAGSERLDAAVLLATPLGYPELDRLKMTCRAVRAELSRGPLLFRYTGMEKEEGAFLACSFWCIETLAMCGERDEARALMDEVLALAAADQGIYHEMIDPETGSMLGNFPQGLSHIAMIHAADVLSKAYGVPT